MKTRRLFNAFALVVVFCLITSTLCSCKSKKELEEDLDTYQARYQEQILSHFCENEKVFNRIAANFYVILEGVEDIDNYRYFSLENKVIISNEAMSVQNDYLLLVGKYMLKEGERVTTGEAINFLEDTYYNSANLTETELNRIFVSEEDYRYSENLEMMLPVSPELIKYREASLTVSSSEDGRGPNFVNFFFSIDLPVSRGDEVYMILTYSRSGEAPESTGFVRRLYQIDDHWYLDYRMNLSPLI